MSKNGGEAANFCKVWEILLENSASKIFKLSLENIKFFNSTLVGNFPTANVGFERFQNLQVLKKDPHLTPKSILRIWEA